MTFNSTVSPLERNVAIALILAVSASCKPGRGTIFEWVPVDEPVAGSAGQVASEAGEGGRGRHAGDTPEAGVAGSEMMGQSGTRPPLDGNVEFKWTETQPGGGACRGGWYVGGFACASENVLSLRLEGTIEINLTSPSEMQQLEVMSGLASVFDPTGAVTFTTPVTGKAECTSRNFTGEIPEKFFVPDQPGLGFQLLVGLLCGPSNSVQGTLTGRLDPEGLAVDGQIMLMIGTCSCVGELDLRATR